MSNPTPRGPRRVTNNYPPELAQSLRQARDSGVNMKVRKSFMTTDVRQARLDSADLMVQSRRTSNKEPVVSPTPTAAVEPANPDFGYVSLEKVWLHLHPKAALVPSTPEERMHQQSQLFDTPGFPSGSLEYRKFTDKMMLPEAAVTTFIASRLAESEARRERNQRVAVRAPLLLEDVDVCAYFSDHRGTPELDPNGETWHSDHIYCHAHYREHDNLYNMTKCCASCSREKGDRTLEEMGWALTPTARRAALNIAYSDLLLSLPKTGTKRWNDIVEEMRACEMQARNEQPVFPQGSGLIPLIRLDLASAASLIAGTQEIEEPIRIKDTSRSGATTPTTVV